MSEGQSWSIEIETDCFCEDDGLVVSIWMQNTEPDENDGKPQEPHIAQATAEQARGMAAALIKCAEHLEENEEKT